ncbi:MAG: sigma-70 family RNA polymerase sigma factor [Bryobacterales bacterium]|nr:sigma-70 family RNA polymerase sigma factor [Bryobacterales bacterium]
MTTPEVTELLQEWSAGKKTALDSLTPVVYDELRRLAAIYLHRERPGHTLQATAVVHEAYMRLVDQRAVQWQNRAHFFGIAAQMIRRILVDHARGVRAAKRGGGAVALSLDEAHGVSEKRDLEVEALDDALHTLSQVDTQQARVVELRFFTGLSIEETAEVLGISESTVKRDWISAKAWLFRELSKGQAKPETP